MPGTVMSVADYGRAPSEHTCSGADTANVISLCCPKRIQSTSAERKTHPLGGAIIKHHVTSQIDRDYRRLFHVLRTVC